MSPELLTPPALLLLADLKPATLEEVVTAAALMRRVDRKYLVPVQDAATLTRVLAASHRVLEIAGRRSTRYCSTYFDTADLRSCRDHVQGRRLRWKARTRLYVDDHLCRFEVKVKNGRGETVKHALDVDPDVYGRYGATEKRFATQVLGAALTLHPVLEVSCTRSTLADLTAGTRVTFDTHVAGTTVPGTWCDLRAGTVSFDRDVVIVETKGTTALSAADRALHALGHHPRSVSKYATCASLLSDVADNDVRRLIGRHLHLNAAETVSHPRRAS